MTMDQMNVPPASPPPAPPMMPKRESGMGGVVAVIVIVVLLALGGIYYLMTQDNLMLLEGNAMPTMEEVANSNDPAVQAAMMQGASDSLADIQADVNATDFSGVDAELGNLDAEVQ